MPHQPSHTTLRGWANYFQRVVSKLVFNKANHVIRQMIFKWAERRHPTKRRGWVWKTYFTKGKVRGFLSTKIFESEKRKNKIYCIYSLCYTPIVRHVKIKQGANPFLKEYDLYFENRAKQRITQRANNQTSNTIF